MASFSQIATFGLGGFALALAGCGAPPGGETSNTSATDLTAAESVGTPTEYCELTGQDEAVGECARFERQYADLDAGRDAFSPQEAMKEGETKVVTYAVSRLPRAVQGEGGEVAEAIDEQPPEPTPEPDAMPDVAYKNGGSGPEPDEATSTAPADPAPTGLTREEIDAAIADTDRENAAAVGMDGDAGGVVTGEIKVARFMYACLSGHPHLRIEPEGCQSRDTREDPQVVWNWNVTARQPGEALPLNLRSGVEVRTRDGEPRRIGQRAENKTIRVSVTARGRFARTMNELTEWLKTPLGAIAALTTLVLALGGLYGAFKKARKGEGAAPKS